MPKIKEPVPVWGISTRDIARRGREIFRQIGPMLEPEHKGQYVAIDPDSRDYFIAADRMGAINAGRAKYPGRIFYLARVGFRAATSLKGRLV